MAQRPQLGESAAAAAAAAWRQCRQWQRDSGSVVAAAAPASLVAEAAAWRKHDFSGSGSAATARQQRRERVNGARAGIRWKGGWENLNNLIHYNN